MFCLETPRSFHIHSPPSASASLAQMSYSSNYPRALQNPQHSDGYYYSNGNPQRYDPQLDHASSESAGSSPGLPPAPYPSHNHNQHHHANTSASTDSTPSPRQSAPPSLSGPMHPSVAAVGSSSHGASPTSPTTTAENRQYSFISLQGSAIRKRPRRRYDEIERLYTCSFPGCTKSYGTLNHLNAHVTMQRHGEKRSPNEFKEMRKQWRKQKKDEQDRASAIAHYHSIHANGGAPDLAFAPNGAATPPRSASGSVSSAVGPVTTRISTHLNSVHDHIVSPNSYGYPSPSEYSPVDSEAGSAVNVHQLSAAAGNNSPLPIPHTIPRRMSLPNLANPPLSGLGLEVAPSAHHSATLGGSYGQRASPHAHYPSSRNGAEYLNSPRPDSYTSSASSMALPSLTLSAAPQDEQWLQQSGQEFVPRSQNYGNREYGRQYDMPRDSYVPQSAPAHQISFGTDVHSSGMHHYGLPEPLSVPRGHENYSDLHELRESPLDSIPQTMSDPIGSAQVQYHASETLLTSGLSTHREE